uniref:Uncharacterized protein n=1 Tax=Rhizophora mucronata TaxID=61149 RepID=A0A2P2P3A2_RHIMU
MSHIVVSVGGIRGGCSYPFNSRSCL